MELEDNLRRYVPEVGEEVALSHNIPRMKKQPPLVVHTAAKSRTVRRWESMSSLPWNQRLCFFLTSRGIVKPTEVQSVMWPLVSRLSSVLAVGPPSQGKTLGWLLPLLDSLYLSQYPDLPPGHSPVCLVLCPGVELATSLHQTLSQVVTGADLGVRSFLCCSGVPQPQPAELYNGVDVLIASPARLLSLLQSRLISLERCCHLVVEEADTALQLWAREVHQITAAWKRARAKYPPSSQDQIIAVSEKWSDSLEDFTRTFIAKSFNPAVVLASPLEAVVYGELPMTIEYCESQDDTDKQRKLEAIIRENDQSGGLGVVVCCRDSQTTHLVKLYLSELGKKCLTINKESDVFDIHVTLTARSTSVIAVSDPVLPCLQLPAAERGTVLVHWDLPQDSKKYFLFRQMFVTAGLRNILTGQRAQPAAVHFLLSPRESQAALNTVLPFLHRCQLEVPPPLVRSLEELRERKARQGPLCLELVELGACRGQQTGKCPGRHQLDYRLDQPSHLDLQGQEVSFTILQVESPVRYWVRLSQLDSVLTSLSLRLAKHFSTSEARRPLETVQPDTLIAAADGDCVYQRARVLELLTKEGEEEEGEQVVKVKVLMIDKGLEETVLPSDLASLPAELGPNVFPACATRLMVAGVVPGDRDSSWGVSTTISLLAMMDLETQNEKDVVCRARVSLHLEEVVVVDRCQMMELQPVLGKFVCKVETVDFLINQQGGLADKTPLKRLCDLAEEAGIFRPRTEESQDSEDTQASAVGAKASRAFLPLDEPVLVKMTECLDPGYFYLAQEKFWKSVDDLEQKLKDTIEGGKRRRFREDFDKLVAVKEGETYRRAEVLGRVRKVLSNEDEVEAAEPMISEDFKVLFVDEGVECTVSREEMFRVSAEFFTLLPFQGVRCRLAGVSPAGGDRWSVEAGDRLFDLTRTEEDWPRVLKCYVDSKEAGPDNTGPVTYSVHLLLRDTSAEEEEEEEGGPWSCGVNLAEALLQDNLAVRSSEDEDSFEASDGMLEDVIDMEALQKIRQDLKPSGTISGASSASPPPSLPPSSPTLSPSLPPLPPSTPSQPPSVPPSLPPSPSPQPPQVCRAPSRSPPEEVVQKRLPLYWSQARDLVRLNVKIFTAMDLSLDQVLWGIISIILSLIYLGLCAV